MFYFNFSKINYDFFFYFKYGPFFLKKLAEPLLPKIMF